MANSEVIRNLVTKFGYDHSEFFKGCAKVGSRLTTLGKSVQKAGQAMTKSITVPAMAAVSGLTALTLKAASSADDLNTLSAKTGLSTQRLQEMGYAAKFVDVDLETMTGSMVKLTKNMDMARQGSLQQKEAFEQLGIQYKNADGTLRNAKDVWYEAIDVLGNMSNEAERDAMSLRIFGRSAAELNPLIKAGSAELSRLAAEAHKVGAVMSSEDISALNSLNDEVDKMKSIVTAAGAQVAAAFAPALQALGPIIKDTIVPAIKGFAGTLSDIFKWFNSLSPQTQKFILLLAGIAVAAGPAATMIGKLVSGIGGAVRAIASIKKAGGIIDFMKSLTSSAGLVVAGIAILVAAVAALVIAFSGAETKTSKLKKEVDELSESVAESKKKFNEQIADVNQSAAAATNLKKELVALADKEKKTNAEKERMKQLVDQLNKIYPDLALSINEATGQLNMNNKELENNIDLMRKQAETAAYSEALTQAYKDQFAAEKKIEETTENYNSLVEDRMKRMGKTREEVEASAEVLGGFDYEMYTATKAVEDAKGAYDSTTESINYYTKKLDKLAVTTADSNKAITDSNAGALKQTQEEADEYKKIYKSRLDITQNALNRIKSTTNLTYKDMLSNMKANSKAMAKVNANIAMLRSSGLSEGVIQQLLGSDFGMSNAGTIANLAKTAGKKGFKGFGEMNQAYNMGSVPAATGMGPGQPIVVNVPASYGNYYAPGQIPAVSSQQGDIFTGLPEKLAGVIKDAVFKGKFTAPFVFNFPEGDYTGSTQTDASLVMG